MNKALLRNHLIEKRDSLNQKRRSQAASHLFLELSALSLSHTSLLSFSSFGSEIDLYELNHFLAKNNKLFFPRVEEGHLSIYRVTNLGKELLPHPFGFYEPNPISCEKISPDHLSLILVPGLGFDTSYHRIGYGKGYYDRFLKTIPHIPTLGIGFKEQLIEIFPHEAHDIALKSLKLF